MFKKGKEKTSTKRDIFKTKYLCLLFKHQLIIILILLEKKSIA